MRGRPARGREIDERDFHAWLARHLPAGRGGLLPLGDDAAALAPPRGAVAVLTTDALVEGTHFLSDSDPREVGAAAVAVSLSDLAAKGAKPAALLLALVLPRGTPRAWATEVLAAADRRARAFGASVVGGDTKTGPVRAVVGFALGWGRAGRLAPRTAAEVGDVLAVTGSVGRGGLAAARLGRTRDRAHALTALLAVEPRVREGRALARYAHAMLDTSDGLAESAHLLAAASGRRVVVDWEALPLAAGIDRLGRAGADRRRIVFFGGDYELLAAIPARRLGRATRATRAVGGRLTPIGRVARGSGAFLCWNGRERRMPRASWSPFRGPPRLP